MLEHIEFLMNIESAQTQLTVAENIKDENLDKLEEFVHWHVVPGNDENQQAIALLFTEIRNRNATVLNGCITFLNDNGIPIEVDIIQQSDRKVLVIVDLKRPYGLLVIGKDKNPMPRLENILKRQDFRSSPEAVNPVAQQTQQQQTQTPKQPKQPMCNEFVLAGITCQHCIYYEFNKCSLTMLERGELL